MTLDAAQFCLRAAAAAACIALAPNGAAAQTAEQFFKGRVINLYIGFAAGGTYDYYSRLFARFIGKHIPGNPTVVAQSMPGAGSGRSASPSPPRGARPRPRPTCGPAGGPARTPAATSAWS